MGEPSIFSRWENAADNLKFLRERWNEFSRWRAAHSALPMPGVRHRRPRLRRGLGLALLQKLDRMQIRRADKRHLAVARRAVDGDAHFLQAVAGRVDVIDLIGEMAEKAVLAVFFLLPVVSEFDQRRAAALRGFQQTF